MFLFYGRNLLFVAWNGDCFLQDMWEIITSRFANSKSGFLLSISFPDTGEIWAAGTGSLSDLVLFITCKLTQNPTSSDQQHTLPFFFFHYLNPSPSPLIARTVVGKAFTMCGNNWPKAQLNRLCLP